MLALSDHITRLCRKARFENVVKAVSVRHRPPESTEESGFTLIEILVAVVILAIIAGIAFLAINLNSTKGKALYTAMASVAHSAEAFNASLGTYPTVYGAMVETAFEADNTTGATLTTTWNGPYAKPKDMGPNGNLHLNSIASNLTITFSPLTAGSAGALPNGEAYQYAVVANNVPNNIATQAVNACNGQTGNTTGAAGGQCVLEAGTGGTSTVYYVFAQNQYGAY